MEQKMDKKLLLVLVSFTGIIVSLIALKLLNYFAGVAEMNHAIMMGNIPYNMNMYAYSPMVMNGPVDTQQQLMDIKSMIGIGMPLAISIGVINLWRGFAKK